MKNLNRSVALIALLGAFAIGACGNDTLSKVTKLVEETCACKDKACAEKVDAKAKKEISQDDMKKLMKDKPEELRKAIERMSECAAKFDDAE